MIRLGQPGVELIDSEETLHLNDYIFALKGAIYSDVSMYGDTSPRLLTKLILTKAGVVCHHMKMINKNYWYNCERVRGTLLR